MKLRITGIHRTLGGAALAILAMTVSCAFSARALAQAGEVERSFPQSKATIEQVVRAMQSAEAGHLPVLAGFATAADRSLDRYQRGYYQAKIQVSSNPSGGSVVRVSVQVTAWYNDPAGAHSGYQLLTSNGRLEADILDQISDQLAARSTQPVARSVSPPSQPPPAAKDAARDEPNISAPLPRLPDSGGGLSSSLAEGLAEQEKNSSKPGKKKSENEDQQSLQTEVQNLEEILKNQAHPNNLVAIKKSGTPVVATPSLNAKTLFLASAHDEFEMLDFNRDWVHVRISGLSRGWIWRNNLEMPDSIPDADLPPNPAAMPVAAELYHVTREEKALFPGDWAPLRGKLVKIVSVEKINEGQQDTGPQLRLEFAKSVLDKGYTELAQKPQELSGIVLIFDSSDGGMIAATLPALQQWKAGKLSDAALWHECFFDPPESFVASGAPASQ
jgi:hypothetical protein